MTDFEIVPAEEAARVKRHSRRGRPRTELTQALLDHDDGVVLHVPRPPEALRSLRSGLRGLSKRLRTRSDGNGGSYVWVEEVASDD